MLSKSMHVKKGDKVIVIAGKEKSKIGSILQVLLKKDSVLVDGLNIVKKHTRARGNEAGGIQEKEAPIHCSNVMLYCNKCSKGVRIGRKILDDGNIVRVCAKCGEAFDK